MMAVVSELSMNQATALKMQQLLKEKEADLEQCYIRMEKGEPPSDDMERDWLRFLRDEERRLHDREERRMVSFLRSVFYATLNLSQILFYGFKKGYSR